MKAYKLLFLTVLSCFALSCTQDKIEDQTIDNSSDRLAASQFDNSYLGEYKGLFTTVDGLTRGSVVVTLTPNNVAIAQIKLSSGEQIELKSTRVKLTEDGTIDNLSFSSEGLSSRDVSMKFSVEGNGLNPSISDVVFETEASDILIAKNLSRVPLTPITGTFDCTNCASIGVGFPNNRTWNVMSVGTGDQTYMVQVSYFNRVYTSMGTQDGCFGFMGYDVCTIEGSLEVLGFDVAWDGTHIYDGSDNLACSEVAGVWSAPGYGPGAEGTFQSDSDCNSSVVLNDAFENAFTIECGDSMTGNTVMATNNDAPDDCDTVLDTANGVWYSYTAAADGNVTVDTFGSGYDTKLGVFSGSADALTCVGGNDDAVSSGGTLQSEVVFSATSGMTYSIYVTGYSTRVGEYTLNVTCN